MKLRLIFKNLTRQPLRTALTMLGVAASIFIFATLLSLDRGTQAMVEQSSSATIVTVFEKYKACPPYSKLPVSYADQIAELPHVVAVMPEKFLLSNCKTTTDMIAIHGVEADKLRKFREIEIAEAEYAACAGERGAAIIGSQVAEKYGWAPGDQVTLQQLGGVSFTVRGVYKADGSHDNLILVDREYLELSTNQIGWVTLFNVLVD